MNTLSMHADWVCGRQPRGSQAAPPAQGIHLAGEPALADAVCVARHAPAAAPMTQYRNALTDLFGADRILPTSLEPDVREGLSAWGPAPEHLAPRVEQYEDAACNVAEQLWNGPTECRSG